MTPSYPLRFPSFAAASSKSFVVITSVRIDLPAGNRQMPYLRLMENHELNAWLLMSQRSAKVISPSLRAELTASPRLLTLSFLKMLWRCVSIDGAASTRSFAIRFVVCPFATARSTCISREVRFTLEWVGSGVVSTTRRTTSGIILRGIGFSFRKAASKARRNSVGPASFRT